MKHLLYFIVVFSSYIMCAQDAVLSVHRRPHAEGWRWVTEVPQSFSKTHEDMGFQEADLQKLVLKDNEIKNVCVVRFSFIDENNIVVPSNVMEKHVFVSGVDNIDVDRGNKPKNKEDSYYKIGKAGGLAKSNKYLFSFERDKPENEEGYVFVCPEKLGNCDHFVGSEHIIRRLNNLYQTRCEQISDTQEPLVPYLALEWARLQSQENADLGPWFEKANGKGPYHKSSTAEPFPESKAVFFTHNQDSEQKLLYYLNSITCCAAEYNEIQRIVNKCQKLLQKSKYLQITCKTRKCIQETDHSKISRLRCEIQERLDDAAKGLQGFNFESTDEIISQLNKCYEELLLLQKSMRGKKPKAPNYYYEKLLDTIRFLTLSAFPIIEQKPIATNYYDERLLELLEFIGKLEDAFKIEVYEQKVEKLDALCQEFSQLYMKSFEEGRTISEFQKVLRKHQKKITTIILHIHNTFDCCFRCAPDLAQELRHDKGFVNFFKNLVKDKNGDGQDVSFKLFVTCRSRRFDKWCTMCGDDSFVTSSVAFDQCILPITLFTTTSPRTTKLIGPGEEQ